MRRDIKGDSFPARRGVRRQASGGSERNLKEVPQGGRTLRKNWGVRKATFEVRR